MRNWQSNLSIMPPWPGMTSPKSWKKKMFFFYQILRIYPQNVVKPTDLVKSFLAYSNQNNSATVWKLTAQANRKVISEITLPRLPGAEWLVIISISVAKLLVAIRYWLLFSRNIFQLTINLSIFPHSQCENCIIIMYSDFTRNQSKGVYRLKTYHFSTKWTKMAKAVILELRNSSKLISHKI